MSNTALTWAWQQHTGSAGAKAVLVALAEHADDAGCAWPSQQRLAAMTEQSVRSVARHLAHLEQTGLIARTNRSRGHGRGRATDHYRLHLGPDTDRDGHAHNAATAPAPVDNRLQPDTVSGDNLTGKTLQPDTATGCSPTNLPTCHLQPDTVTGDRTLREPSTAAAAAHARTRATPPVDNQQQRQQPAPPTPTPTVGGSSSGPVAVDAVTDQPGGGAPAAAETVIQQLRKHGQLTGDLGPLRTAVADALARGCHPQPLAAALADAADRAHTPGLLVTIANQADPADFPAPPDPTIQARTAAIEAAWRAGREHAYQHHDPADPRTARNAVMAAIEETLTVELDRRWPDRRAHADQREAFAAGAGFQPWTAARDLAAAWTPHSGPAWQAEHAPGTQHDTSARQLQAVG